MSSKEKLTDLPSVSMGRKDDLLISPGLEDNNEIQFHHTIPPMEINPGFLRCNSTYCIT